jgi:hypothetical protein
VQINAHLETIPDDVSHEHRERAEQQRVSHSSVNSRMLSSRRMAVREFTSVA